MAATLMDLNNVIINFSDWQRDELYRLALRIQETEDYFDYFSEEEIKNLERIQEEMRQGINVTKFKSVHEAAAYFGVDLDSAAQEDEEQANG